MKSWEIIADNLCKAGWSLGWVSAVDSEARTIWIVDAHRDDGKRFIARSDEKVTAFLGLESAIRPASVQLSCYETSLSNPICAGVSKTRLRLMVQSRVRRRPT